MEILAGILALLIAAAGWYYMFYSRAAQNLSAIEGGDVNRRRVILRRINGFLMCALAVVFYIGVAALARRDIKLFAGMMFAVLALMAALLVFGLIDLRLTHALRKQLRRDRDDPPHTP